MSSGVDDLYRRTVRLAELYSSAPSLIVREAARTYRETILVETLRNAPSLRLSGVGQRGARIGVTTKFEGTSAIVQATGPFQLIERDTKAHDIPRATRTRRRRTAAGRLSHKRESTGRSANQGSLLVINGNIVTGPVHHPGTKGKHPFEKGVLVGDALAGRNAQRIVVSRLAAIYR